MFEELLVYLEGAGVLRGHPIRIASLQDLIRMKRSASRPQDLTDIRELEALARKRNGD